MHRNTVQLEKPFFRSHLFTHWELASPEIQYAIANAQQSRMIKDKKAH